MKVQVTVNNVKIIEPSILNENEYNIHNCEFEFTEEYNGLTEKAVFTDSQNKSYVETIVDNKCSIPIEVCKRNERVKIGVYAYAVENEELLLRYSPQPTEFFVHEGSYKEGQNSTPPTPSEIEQLQAQITSNKNDIEEMQDNIVEINEQQEMQDETIQNITETIGTINETIGTINETIGEINQDIDNLENTKADKSEIPTKTSDLINDSDFVSDANYVHTDNNFTNEKDAQITTNASNITTLQSTKADKTEIPTKTSDLTNDSGFINKNVNDLTNYTLKTNTGSLIDLEINETTYVITLSLKDVDGNVISTDTIDLPLESVVVGGSYDAVNKKIVLTLENGNTVDIPVGDLIAGLQTEITSQNKLASDLVDDTNSGNKFVTTSEKQVWNAKYDKPVGGIPKTDLASDVQTSLEKADSAIQEHQDITGKEDKSNKVTELTDQSTDTQYPSAKCVYDELEAKQSEIDNLQQDVEDLRGACLSVEGTGTDITLNNTAQGRLLKNELSGRTEQEQLQGINLVPMNRPSFTLSGVTITNKGNSLVLNGTKNSGSGDYITLNFSKTLKANTDYTLAIELLNGSVTDIPSFANIAIGTSTNANYHYMTITNLTTKGQIKASRFKPSEDVEIKGFYLYYGGSSNPVFTNYEIRVWLVEGNYTTETIPAYEPYCGGIPSPNPDFPQPIKNVTGQANVKIQNKNLAWNGWAEDFVSKINNINQARLETKDNKNCLRYGAAAGYGDYDNKYMFKIPFKPNTQYTFVFDLLAEINTGNIAIQYTDNTTTSLTNIPVNSWNKVILASVANKTIKYLRVQYNNGVCWMDLDTFMVLEGQYTAETMPSYVPHQEQNYPFTFAEGQRGMQGTQLLDDGIHNNRVHVIVNGTENWQVYSNKEHCFKLQLKYTSASGLCTHYQNIGTTYLNIKNGIYLTFTNVIIISDLRFSSVEDFKSWLVQQYNNGTPLEVEYVIRGDEEKILYNATQQAQYNNIKANASSYDDITIISSESDELGFNMNVVAVADANKVIDAQNNEIDTIKSRLDLLEA